MEPSQIGQWFATESGFSTVLTAGRDIHLLLLARLFRMFAYGSTTLIFAIYFSALGYSDAKIGLFMTLTLIGDMLISLALTSYADSIGRRRTLLLGACLMIVSGIVFALTGNYYLLLLAAIIGVISPSGKEVGPFKAVEESSIAHLTNIRSRTDVLAWYTGIGTLGTALGAFVCGWATQALSKLPGWTDASVYRAVFWAYSLIGCVKAGLTLLLSPRCDSQPLPQEDLAPNEEREAFLNNQEDRHDVQHKATPKSKTGSLGQISRNSWSILLKLCCLFSVDSLASGLVAFSFIAYFMERKFHINQGKLGTVMAVAQFASAVSNICSASVARRIGLIRAMVFTHLPSSIFLILIPMPASLILSVLFIFGRASLSSMDQAPRSAFVSAVVLPTERTAVMGVVNTVKTLSQSGGPIITGILAGKDHFWVAFVAAGAMKIAYDLSLLALFVHTKTEEHRDAEPEPETVMDSFELASEDDDEELDDRKGALGRG
ncbi:MAG: para-aminobenzoate synthase, (PABA) [Bogoriella megaspora]|nr:MAG: para-aminobenzoate synthase, (PABA) [Bogoriella megaspora]